MFNLNVSKENTIAHKLIFIGSVLSLLFFALEPLRYEGFIYTHFLLSPHVIMFLAFIFLHIAKLVTDFQLREDWFKAYFYSIIPISLIAAISMAIIENFTFKNYIYAHIRIHAIPFQDMALYITLFGLVFFNRDVLLKFWRRSLFTSCVTAFALTVFFKWRLDQAFRVMEREDTFVEWMTFFAYFVASIFTFLTWRIVRQLDLPRKLKRYWVFLFIIATIGLFVIAKEEISWGQRIFGIETPEALVEINQQDETTIHNISFVFRWIYHAYLVLGIYGMTSWLVRYLPWKFDGIEIRKILDPFLSQWYLVPYFAPMSAYVVWRLATMDGSYQLWEETSEMYMGFGVLGIFWLAYLRIKAYRDGKRKKLVFD